MSIPGSASPLFLASTAAAGAYDIPRSLRFNPADSSYLNRTPSSAGNRRTWTWSGWVKRTALDTEGGIFSTYAGAHPNTSLFWESNVLKFHNYNGSSYTWRLGTAAVYRDVSAWYHIVLAFDSTETTASDRAKIWVNGAAQTLSGTEVPLDNQSDWNSATQHDIGRFAAYFDGYMADIHFIDGQALAATDFGEYDTNNVWQPKKFAGTYGTNGFHLDFSDTSSNSALGTDSSGQGNNWTVNNLTALTRDVSAAGTTSGSPYSATFPWSTAFDGSITSIGAVGNTAAANGYVHTFTTAIPCTTAAFVLYYDYASALEAGNGCAMNGVALTAAASANWTKTTNTLPVGAGSVGAYFVYTVNLGGTPLSSVGVGNTMRIAAVLIDGAPIPSSGAGNDALRDSPVNGDPTNDTGAGNEITGNYCTLNPLDKATVASLSDGNLRVNSSSAGAVRGTFAYPKTGKWYHEVTPLAAGYNAGYFHVGIATAASNLNAAPGYDTTNEFTYWQNGNKTGGASYSSNGFGAGDVIGIAFDAGSGSLTFYKNGVSQGVNSTGLTGTYFPYAPVWSYNAAYNFGQRAFAYPVSGYKCLNTANLSDPLIADGSTAFDAKLWVGNGTNQNISTSFSPDWVWVKERGGTGWHNLYDTVRGVKKGLITNDTRAEQTYNDGVTAFNSDSFTVSHDGASTIHTNSNGDSYVGWAWSAGDNSNKTYAVTVSNPGSGNKFYADGALQPTLTLAEGSTYKFDQSSGTNSTHPLRFSTTSDGTHGGGSEYTTGVTTVGTPGSAGAYTQIVIAASAPTLYAYCTNHSGMGFQINTSDTAGYTIPAGSYNSASYNQSQTWSSNTSIPGGSPSEGTAYANLFDGATSAYPGDFLTAADGKIIQIDFATSLTNVTSIRYYSYNGSDRHKVNSGSWSANSGSGEGWKVAYSGSAITLTRLELQKADGASYVKIGAIEVDGKMLVDSGVTPPGENSISSRVQADPSKGFSIVSYTGNATIGATVSHGLNAAPELIIAKTRTQTYDWPVYIKPVGPGKAFYLNSTAAAANSTGIWGNIDPTSSVFTLGGDPQANYSGGSIIAYCFAPVAGYSLFSSYVGNSSAEGPFVFTGFRPAFILIRSTAAGNWYLYDSAREESNLTKNRLYPNLSNAEDSGTANSMDIVSNGFKLRSSHGGINLSGQTFIFMSFASHPFKTARAR